MIETMRSPEETPAFPVRLAVKHSPPYPFNPISAPIKLDQNECPFDFPEELKTQVMERLSRIPWNRYPEIDALEVRKAIADYESWPVEGVVVTTGSNLMIRTLLQLSGLGHRILTVKPSFPLYALEAGLFECPLTELALQDDLTVNPDELSKELKSGSGIVYFPQPQVPTAHLEPDTHLYALAEHANHRWMVVLDEAYHQFSGTDYRDWIKTRPNWVSVRTFSKAWGLASLRMGYALCHPDLGMELQKVVMPFSCTPWQALTVKVALEHPEYMDNQVRHVNAEKARMFERLQHHPVWHFYPSQTNFFLFRTPNAEDAYRFLLERGILVRRQDALFGLEGCLRVTLGSCAENDAFLEAAFAVFAD